MEAPPERVELLVTVHCPVRASLLARLAAVSGSAFADARCEPVDGELDLVFVRPVPDTLRLLDRQDGQNRSPANGSSGRVESGTPAPEGAIPGPTVMPPDSRPLVARVGESPRVGTPGTAEAPVILDPAAGDAETRALRLRLYLDRLDLDDRVPDDVEKAKDSHRRGVTWKDSQGRWHCPWCPEAWAMAAHAGRHRPGCSHRPGSHKDAAAIEAARAARGVASTV